MKPIYAWHFSNGYLRFGHKNTRVEAGLALKTRESVKVGKSGFHACVGAYDALFNYSSCPSETIVVSRVRLDGKKNKTNNYGYEIISAQKRQHLWVAVANKTLERFGLWYLEEAIRRRDNVEPKSGLPSPIDDAVNAMIALRKQKPEPLIEEANRIELLVDKWKEETKTEEIKDTLARINRILETDNTILNLPLLRIAGEMQRRDVPYPAHPDFAIRVARLLRMSSIHFAVKAPKILQDFMNPEYMIVDWERYLREKRGEILSTMKKWSDWQGTALLDYSLPQADNYAKCFKYDGDTPDPNTKLQEMLMELEPEGYTH